MLELAGCLGCGVVKLCIVESALRGLMERSANFLRINAKGEMYPVPPPLEVKARLDTAGNCRPPRCDSQ